MADELAEDQRQTEEERARREHTRLLAATRIVPSVDDHTWIQLLLAYVDGRPKAAHILGDYLEGEGRPRIRNADADQRLRHALGLLPAVLAHEIACDLVDHVLTVDQSSSTTFAQLVATKRQWLHGLVSDAQLKEARKIAQAAALTPVREAVAHALVSSPAPGVAQSTSHLAATAVATLRVRGVRHGDWHNAYRAEIRWQVAHVRGRLARGGR